MFELNSLFGTAELNFVLDFILCLIAGYLIGAERESRGKDAGISTHTMVILGSMLFTFMSMSVGKEDPTRIAAQIVTGIGFLGAGLIIKEGVSVKNLTTASSVWFAGAIGMAFGFNYHVIGLIATIGSVFIPRLPKFGHKKKHDHRETN